MELSHGVMAMLVFCAEKRPCGLGPSSLGRYRGFNSDGNFDFSRDNGTSATILDAVGKVITIRV